MGAKEYKAEHERRFNDTDTLHLPVRIGKNPAFFCRTLEIYTQIIAIEQFTNKCLIDEILLTNDIEGVHSNTDLFLASNQLCY